MYDPNVRTRIKRFMQDRTIPATLHLDLLYACDLDCRHCYLDEKTKIRPRKTDEIIDVMQQAAELGAINVLFSGGEIFLRKDLFTLIEAARNMRFCVQLKTHGGRITADDAKKLATLGVRQVDFSVYALDPEIHDTFTQRKGSLQRTLQGINLVAEQGVKVKVNCSVTKYNAKHVRELNDYFVERGIETNLAAAIRGTNSMDLSPCSMNLSYDEKVDLRLWQLEKKGGPTDKAEPPPDEEATFCSAGHTLVYVAPDFKVYPCVSFPMEVGDLDTHSLREIWQQSKGLSAVRATRRSDTGMCGGCAARKECEYCPGKAYIANDGNWKSPPKSTCDDAFVRQEASDRYRRGERSVATDAEKKPPRFMVRVG